MNIQADLELYKKLKRDDKLLAIDVGTKTFGLAVGIWGLEIVTSLPVIIREKYSKDILILKKHIQESNIKALIFGLPLNMDGTSGAKVQAVKTIARNISRDTFLPYSFQDERLSTSAATDRLIEMGVKPSRRDKVIDSHAAIIILESYFYSFGGKTHGSD